MKILLVGLFVLAATSSTAEDFGAVVNVAGDSPTRVLFLKCRSNQREPADDDRPAVCKEREVKATFNAKAARLTNLGDTVVWVHVGEDKVPLLPRSVMTVGALGSSLDRVFLSVLDAETARIHVFASSQNALDRAYVYPEPEKR